MHPFLVELNEGCRKDLNDGELVKIEEAFR